MTENTMQTNGIIIKDHIILESNILEQLNISKDGYWLEFGVYSGSTINKLSKLCNKIYGFDSFEGLPEDWAPGHPKGTFKTEIIPQVKNNVELVIGLFEESIPKFLNERTIDKITFINVDCDLYSSTKTIFKYFGPYITSGTYIYFDEYIDKRNPSGKDESDAFFEFLTDYKLNYKTIAYTDYTCLIQIL
jgi:hypothetical protein